MICYSLTGQETGERLEEGFRNLGFEAVLYKKSKYLPDSIPMSTGEWTGEQFGKSDAIVFIGACGIAVRSIAPHIVGKKTDPAVLVIDECGQFVISLLSGHLGGANRLTEQAAEILDAVPVVTTATDLHRRFAVDVFAKENGCSIFHMKAAKEVSAALLAGREVGFYSEFPYEGELPRGLVACDRDGMPISEAGLSCDRAGVPISGVESACDRTEMPISEAEFHNSPQAESPSEATASFQVGIAVTIHQDCLPFPSTVQVVPRTVAIGLGCRKGREAAGIRKAAEESLAGLSLFREAVSCIASIDLKKEEPGILSLAEEWQVSYVTFSEEALKAVPGSFTPSAFVREITGVDNVCERSAVLAAGQGPLIQKKSAAEGVTTAAALRDWRIHFE